MVSERKTLNFSGEITKESLTPYLLRGWKVVEVGPWKTYKSEYWTSGTPDTYTGSIDSNGNITITKHLGEAPQLKTSVTRYREVIIERAFSDGFQKEKVKELEEKQYMTAWENIYKNFLIQKELFGVAPTGDSDLKAFSKLFNIKGKIKNVILDFIIGILPIGLPIALWVTAALEPPNPKDGGTNVTFIYFFFVLITLGVTVLSFFLIRAGIFHIRKCIINKRNTNQIEEYNKKIESVLNSWHVGW